MTRCNHLHLETQTVKDGDFYTEQLHCLECHSSIFLEVPIAEVIERAARCGIEPINVTTALKEKLNIDYSDVYEIDHEDAEALIQYLIEKQQNEDVLTSLMVEY